MCVIQPKLGLFIKSDDLVFVVIPIALPFPNGFKCQCVLVVGHELNRAAPYACCSEPYVSYAFNRARGRREVVCSRYCVLVRAVKDFKNISNVATATTEITRGCVPCDDRAT